MPCGKIAISELDEFIREIDSIVGTKGVGPATPESIAYTSNFSLDADIRFGKRLDPFSDDYMKHMINLYELISGRELNQASGELFDVPHNIHAPNPYGSRDIKLIAKHAKTVFTSMHLAELPDGASVLDMGCGWGLSSEMIGFTGASVHGVDINPSFIELASARCKARNIDFTGTVSEFEMFQTDNKFDCIFFYECLHHAVNVNSVIRKMSMLLKPGGKIVFAGEPINNLWWKHWGLRLDALSVYCIRNFGWFESGWSQKFLELTFRRNKLALTMHAGVGLDGGDIGCAALLSSPA